MGGGDLAKVGQNFSQSSQLKKNTAKEYVNGRRTQFKGAALITCFQYVSGEEVFSSWARLSSF